MAWTKDQIEERIRERIRGFTDDEIRSADADAHLGLAFAPPFSDSEGRLAAECWDRIVGERLRKL
jgi:hypothetical protein